ncbi:carbamate kinase [Salidesulfovibrio onnuriiensis]|uniref:carbamate kinase n=1 Tax=Salidesulfovibrio onnuriiensis TaxID=2583823 RepID=UPI0011C85337|nr:carbamate kinase [Salidesulfovibrio onnuriiensis]
MKSENEVRRVVVALGGNALIKRGDEMNTEVQRKNVALVADALSEIAREHELVITHGNGPQVGLLALQASSMGKPADWPLDVLGAQSEGMIGYLIEQEMGNRLPDRKYATLLTQVEVDPGDPAFDNPTKPIGPVYSREQADQLASEYGWSIAPDNEYWRRVVPSPLPKRIYEIDTIRMLVDNGVIVVCSGGGGIPTMYVEEGKISGVEAVIDKDRVGSLLAGGLDADMFIILTDVSGVYSNWGEEGATPIREISPKAIREYDFAKGSMGPKVEAACEFAERTRKTAVIGALEDLSEIIEGRAGTRVSLFAGETTWY